MRTSLRDKLIAGVSATAFVLALHHLGLDPSAVAAEREGEAPAIRATAPAAGPGGAAEKKTTRYPIRGKLKAVDASAQTITLGGTEKDRVFQVNAQTEIIKQGKPATLSDAVAGDLVGGLAERRTDGTVVALKLRFGPKTEPEENSTTAPKRKARSANANPAEMRPAD